MNLSPVVSVVIATYRREKLVCEAIESALAQRGVSLEVIVVDDSGEATARRAVEGFRDERVRYRARPHNSGRRPGLVRNEGAATARGEFLHFLDDDDRLADGALAHLVGAISGGRRPGMAFGRVLPFGDDERVLAHERRYFAAAAQVAAGLHGSRLRFATRLLFADTCLINSACLVRRDVHRALSGYDTEVPIIEDVDFFLRAGRAFGFAFVDHPVLHYRTGAPSITHALAHGPGSEVRAGYRRMYDKYKKRYGAAEFYALKVAERARGHLAKRLRRRP